MVILLVLAIVAPVVLPVFLPWSRIMCEEQEVDLFTAQKRTTRFFYWMPVHRRLEDTAVSRALPHHGGALPAGSPRRHWVPVCSFGLYVKHSPHFKFHSAFDQIATLELIWNEYEVSPETREASSCDLLRIWMEGNGASYWSHYCERFESEVELDAEWNAPIKDLPSMFPEPGAPYRKPALPPAPLPPSDAWR